MPSDFATLCSQARERLEFSQVPLDSIRRSAQELAASTRARRRPVLIALLAALPIAAAAAGLWHGTRLSFIDSGINSGAMQFQFNRGESKAHPTLSQIQAVARNVDFPVVLPAGLPQGTFPVWVMRAGQSAIVLQYNLPGYWRRDDHLLLIILANPQAVGASRMHQRTKYELIMGNRRGGTHFMAGKEEVFVMRSSLRPQELEDLKDAMIAAGRRAAP